MSPYSITEDNDDDGWGFYVILDIEESFINILSLQKQYTRRVSALPTIEEGIEHAETHEDYKICTKDNKNNTNSEQRYICFICIISCLYVWILLTS